ncbi:Di-copper centre-containing protein [Dichomitus squalens]|uniref:Di-copper centre-containing protein n=1 Tax=Dichomitus squalens TaxID=114155 RepID=A0A4V2K1S3_9APHY|nr:Di-copper centre-containing protein [Dichomitus squalens]
MRWMRFASSLLAALSFFTLEAVAWAECTKPEVRKEWRTLSTSEKAAWIAAVNCVSKFPHDPKLAPIVPRNISDIPPVNESSSYWDDLTYIHMDLNTRIHFTGYFLPWHRWYVAVVESVMKSRCGFKGTVPYWDWRLDYKDVKTSPLFTDPDPISGFGTWGDSAKDFQVQDGGFANIEYAYPVPHRLRRNYTLQPWLQLTPEQDPTMTDVNWEGNASFVPQRIQELVDHTPGDFPGFQMRMEAQVGPHANGHQIVGADMAGYCPSDAYPNCLPAPTFSVNEPLFQLHHAMVDKVWYEWQHANPEKSFWAFHGGSIQNQTSLAAANEYPNGMPPWISLTTKIQADGLFPEVTIADVMNTTGGYLCYVYE